jgi:RNA polymerase sigma-70 factor (ECF subfamily)
LARRSLEILESTPKVESSIEVSDSSLVQRVQEGDTEAFHQIVLRYQDRLKVFVIGVLRDVEDARDVIQETFVKVFFSLKNFRGESSLKTYIFKVALNLSIDLKRKGARQGGGRLRSTSISEYDEASTSFKYQLIDEQGSSDPGRVFANKEDLGRLTMGLQEISSEHRTTLLLREVHGLSYQEIADITNTSLGTVMSRLHYARKKLVEIMAKDEC